MKRVILLALVALFLAAPASAQKTRELLGSTRTNLTLDAMGECVPFHLGGQTTPNPCTFQYYSWYPGRDATITEIEVVVIQDTDDMTGDCGLYIKTSGTDEAFDVAFAGPFYVDMTGDITDVWDAGTAYRNRINVDLDVEAETAYGFTFQDWPDVPSICLSGTTNPVIQIRLWGEWRE